MTPKVVHVKSAEWKATAPDMRLYIGRAMPGFPESIWANPYRINKSMGTTREWVLNAYESWLRKELGGNMPRVRSMAQLIEDMNNHDVIGCWCKSETLHMVGQTCHGDILTAVYELEPEDLTRWLAGEFSVLG